MLIVFVTASTLDEAQRLSKAAVEARVAACATILPVAQSTYWWEGKIVNEEESLVLIKTTADRYQALENLIRGAHSYKTPEILALPVSQGLTQYLEWVRAETTGYGI